MCSYFGSDRDTPLVEYELSRNDPKDFTIRFVF